MIDVFLPLSGSYLGSFVLFTVITGKSWEITLVTAGKAWICEGRVASVSKRCPLELLHVCACWYLVCRVPQSWNFTQYLNGGRRARSSTPSATFLFLLLSWQPPPFKSSPSIFCFYSGIGVFPGMSKLFLRARLAICHPPSRLAHRI